MSSKKKQPKNRDAKKKSSGTPLVILAALVGTVAVVSLLLLIGNGPDLQKIQGKWLRTDGGYVIEIRSIDEDGTMDAGYYNPKPINVSVAKVTLENDVTKVFIELRDVNYPGSTYTLEYNPDSDAMQGLYYQAVQKQSFTVTFVRME